MSYQSTTSRGCSTIGAAAIDVPSIACCRSCTPNYGGSPRVSFVTKARAHAPANRAGSRGVLRLIEQRSVSWENRAHFFGVAAQVMRRVLVDHARRKAARKRGDGAQRVPLEEAAETTTPSGSGARAGSRVSPVGADSIRSRTDRGAANVWWIDDRRSCARAEGVAVNGQTAVANRESVAHARAGGRGPLS